MAVQIVHPNPLIQALQLAGADWLWPGETLSLFWRTTTETMSMAGWAGYSNPWKWSDVHAAYLKRLGATIVPAKNSGFRLEGCLGVWLKDGQELIHNVHAALALHDLYLPRVNTESTDEESALLWASILAFGIAHHGHPLNAILSTWRDLSPNNIRWSHAHQIVYSFGMELWPTARHMHRIMNNIAGAGEAASLEGLLV